MKKVLVTGGAGFIGSHITEALVQQGYFVTVLDNLSSGKKENLERVMDSVEFVEADVRNRPLVFKLLKGMDACLHQAALAGVPRSLKAPLEYQEVNVGGTLNVLEAARFTNVQKVILASSSSVYGPCKVFPQVESQVANPVSPYAMSKLQAEQLCRLYQQCYQLRVTILRYFNVFGPRQSLTGPYAAVVPNFICSLQDGRRPVIYGDGQQTRDFTYVGNVVGANILALKNDLPEGQIFNIACHEKRSVLDLLDKIGQFLEVKPDPDFRDPRGGDLRHSLASIEKACQLLSYVPQFSFDEGIKQTVRWFQRQREYVRQLS